MGRTEDQAVVDAIIDGDAEALSGALVAGGNPDVHASDGRTALEVAIECDDVAALRQLLIAGANVKAARPDGWTPLHMAVDFEGDCALQNGLPMDCRHIQPLLDAEADPNAVWIGGQPPERTPLDMARSYGHSAAVGAMERVVGEL